MIDSDTDQPHPGRLWAIGPRDILGSVSHVKFRSDSFELSEKRTWKPGIFAQENNSLCCKQAKHDFASF